VTARKFEDIYVDAAEKDPRTHPWGCYGYDDFVLVAASSFQWFSSFEEMRDAILLGLPKWHFDDEEELRKVSETVAAIHDDVKDQEQPSVELLSRINSVIKGTTQLGWWGTFDDLRQGDKEFERDKRGEFRETLEQSGSTPVADDEVDGFVEFVSSYGH